MKPPRKYIRRITIALATSWRGRCAWLLAGLWVVAGCAAKDIDSTYGKRRGLQGGDSVNGTGVLADMFQQAGHRVTTWKRLSPKLQQSNVIVWAPDDFEPPLSQHREFLEQWLASGSGRTLVYIGRDFDAGPRYWRKMQAQAPPEQAVEIARRRAKTQSDHDQQHARMPPEQYARWFVARRDERKKVQLTSLEGPWSEGVDASRIEIELEGRFDLPEVKEIPKPTAKPASKAPPVVAKAPPGRGKSPPPPKFLNLFQNEGIEPQYLPTYRPLLTSGKDILVSEVTEPRWGTSKILVVTNGSFLLNLPLVNHEHRKLAVRLLDACGLPGRTTFLESGPYGLQVYEKEPDGQHPTGLELFTVWPLNVILLHLIAVGVLYCFVRFPIFGRPRSLPADSVSDFGQHIQALGELLEKTGDYPYAHERCNYYQLHVKRDSGVSHKPSRVGGRTTTSTMATPVSGPQGPPAGSGSGSEQKGERPA